MKKQIQKGFTLIELVVVIVILGILAAVAIPKFIDLRGDAEAAAIKGVAGGLESANAINYAACSLVNNKITDTRCVKMTKCSDVGTLLTPTLSLAATASDTAYYLTADTAASTTNGTSVSCTLAKGGSTTTPTYSATYQVTGAGN